MSSPTFNPGDIVTWTDEAIRGVDPRDMLDSALVIRGARLEVIRQTSRDLIARFPDRAIHPINPNSVRLVEPAPPSH